MFKASQGQLKCRRKVVESEASIDGSKSELWETAASLNLTENLSTYYLCMLFLLDWRSFFQSQQTHKSAISRSDCYKVTEYQYLFLP